MIKKIVAADVVGKLIAWHFLYHRPVPDKGKWFAITLIPVVGSVWFLSCGNRVPGRE